MDEPFHILIVDDEPNIRSGLTKGLEKLARRIETASDVQEAIDKLQRGNFQLVIADLRLPGDRDGLELVRDNSHSRSSGTAVVVGDAGNLRVESQQRRGLRHILRLSFSQSLLDIQ